MADRTKLHPFQCCPTPSPTLPEETFWKSVAHWVDEAPEGQVIYRSYVPGKVRQKKNKENIASRAYIKFATPEQVIDFHRGYDEHVFRDSKGNVSTAKIEFAPYQKTTSTSRVDHRQGTIEDDNEYKKFLESLSAKDEPEPPKEPSSTAEPTTTPLIEHLRAQRKAAEASKSSRNGPSTVRSGARVAPGVTPKLAKRGSAAAAAAAAANTTVTPGSSAQPSRVTNATTATASPQKPKQRNRTKKPRGVVANPSPTGYHDSRHPCLWHVCSTHSTTINTQISYQTKPLNTGEPSHRGGRGRGSGIGDSGGADHRGGRPGRGGKARGGRGGGVAPGSQTTVTAIQQAPKPPPNPSTSTSTSATKPSPPAVPTAGPSAAPAQGGGKAPSSRPSRRNHQDSEGARRRLGAALAGISGERKPRPPRGEQGAKAAGGTPPAA